MTDGKIRLQKYLSECGVASRRKSEELIAAGTVKINGRVAQIGDKLNPRQDTVTVRGKKVSGGKRHCYIMLHKPRGFITTMSDELDRKCVAHLVKDVGERVYPVGRLDRDSEGMLLMTNDGEFANAMTHPSRHVSKTYRVTVRETVSEEQLQQLSEGVEIDSGKTAPAQVNVILKESERTVLEFIIEEGKNRQIRKMCEAVGLNVIRLKRTKIGSVKLGMLPQGKWRNLTDDEIHKLMTCAGMKVKKK